MAHPLYRHTAHYVGQLLAQHPARRRSSVASDAAATSALSREQLVERLVDLIVMEEEDAAKDLMGVELGLEGDTALDQYILSLMHKVRDDMNQVPFTPTSLVTPKRPTTRSSSSTLSKSSITFKPRTPLAASAQPLSPPAGLASPPLAPGGSLVGSPSRAASLSAVDSALWTSFSSPSGGLAGLQPLPPTSHAPMRIPSSPSSIGAGVSPVLSPKALSARAIEFKPSPRATHASVAPFAGSPGSPVDWSIGTSLPTASALVGAPSLRSSSSHIAALYSEGTSSSSSMPPTTGPSVLSASPAAARRPSFAAHRSARIDDSSEEEDDFSPFGSLPAGADAVSSSAAWPSSTTSGGEGESFSSSASLAQHMTLGEMDELYSAVSAEELAYAQQHPGAGAGGQGGMTPMDLLASIFTGLSTHELEVALHRHGYDFESTMAALMTAPSAGSASSSAAADAHLSTPLPTTTSSTSAAIAIVPPPAPGPSATAKPFVPREGYVVAGGRNGSVAAIARPLSPTAGGAAASSAGKSPYGGRVCRYYLNGECRRADCRFSHDIERALCRFWLRGQCAKGDQCEFIHTLPPSFDPDTLSSPHALALGTLDHSPSDSPTPTTPVIEEDDFPVLGGAGSGGGGMKGKGAGKADSSSRTRFSSAVKKAPVSTPMAARLSESSSTSSPASTPAPPVRSSAPRSSSSSAATLSAAVPRASSRLPLRPPTLLPTLPTGAALNAQYMAARGRAIELGTQRNACLAKAAEAWKRGDGASAKRFSKDGQELNNRMNDENNAAAEKLVRDRLKIVQEAAHAREGRTRDPRDRTCKGVPAGGGLGVVLGVADASTRGAAGLGAAEREEALCDVHLLHGGEAVLVLEQWLLALEAEGFSGLAYVIVGEEKHTGTQDAGRGASKVRLAQAVKSWLAQWAYPWSEQGGVIAVDPLSHLA